LTVIPNNTYKDIIKRIRQKKNQISIGGGNIMMKIYIDILVKEGGENFI
jgi:NAD(P)H-flavin reductase